MTKYFQLFITIVALGLFARNLQAQVTIGSDTNPQSFSVLELDGTTTGLGLRLPQVTNAAELTTITNSLSTPDLKNSAKGLMVMNLEDKCLYVYDGDSWVSHCGFSDPLSKLKLNASQTFAFLYGYTSIDPYNRGYGIDVSEQIASGQVNLTNLKIAYTDGLGKSISSYTSATVHGLTIKYSAANLSATGTIPLTLSGTPTKRGAFDIPVVIDGQTVQVRIHVGCGMYVGGYSSADNYLLMMCINWGTSTAMDWSLDPFAPDKGINGDYYQWGRVESVANADTPVPFPTTPPGWPGNPAGYNSNQKNFYNKGSENSPVKNESNDPCPSGWRLPTRREFTNGTKESNNIRRRITNENGDAKFNTGIVLENTSVRLQTVLLPAAGKYGDLNFMTSTSGLMNRGITSYLMTSRQDSNPYVTIIEILGIAAVNIGNYPKNNAVTVRCVAE